LRSKKISEQKSLKRRSKRLKVIQEENLDSIKISSAEESGAMQIEEPVEPLNKLEKLNIKYAKNLNVRPDQHPKIKYGGYNAHNSGYAPSFKDLQIRIYIQKASLLKVDYVLIFTLRDPDLGYENVLEQSTTKRVQATYLEAV
jgi:hypothetical protein